MLITQNISSLLHEVNKPTVFTSLKESNKFAYMRYGERLRLARGNMTQTKLSEISGVHQSLISQLENSETATGSEYTPRLARALGISVDWLADEIGDMIPAESPPMHIDLSPSDKQTLNNAQYLPPDALDALIEDARLQAEEKRALYTALIAQRHADETREPKPEPAPPAAPPKRTSGKQYKLPEPGIAKPHAGHHKKRSA